MGTEGNLLRVHLDASSCYLSSLCSDKNVAILDFFTGECVASATSHSEVPTGVRFMQGGKHLVTTGADGCVGEGEEGLEFWGGRGGFGVLGVR